MTPKTATPGATHGAPNDELDHGAAWARLGWLTAISAGFYLLLLILSSQYAHKLPQENRLIWPIIALFAAAFAPAWLAMRVSSRLPDSRELAAWLIGSSVLFRLLLLPTPPFQEIDIYRYVWDGAVLASGENPFRYPIDAVKQAVGTLQAGGAVADPRLDRVARLALSDQGLIDTLWTIHFSQYPSPYPPVSQAVFAAPALVTPGGWSASARLTLLKGVLTLFDLATLLVVMAMVRDAGLPLGRAVAYGWCPLVLKEIANSGHLDSIAIFLATTAVWVAWRGVRAGRSAANRPWLVGSAVLLALGVGAKLFPVVLAPLLFFSWGRRVGWGSALVWGAVFAGGTVALMAPMVATSELAAPEPATPAELIAAPGDGELPPPPGTDAPSPLAETGRTDPTAGLEAFLTTWEMNDLIFMVVVENLRENEKLEPKRRPWFVVAPDAWAVAIVDAWGALIDPEGKRNAWVRSFLLARLLTAVVFGVIALRLAWRAARGEAGAAAWFRAGFLTIAWFWLLAPTQNPWYWCWAVPLLPFARLRAWHALAAFSLLYYLRFWLLSHAMETGVWGTPYDGKHFFYFVVVWIEFLPWFAWLAVEAATRRGGPTEQAD